MKNKAVKKVILELVAGVLLVVGLTGCKEAEGTTPEASSSEVVSEVESEEVSEEVTEDVSEEVVSEEVSEPEIVDGVQRVYYDTWEELSEFFETLNKPVVVGFDFFKPEMGQVILYDGAHYTIEKDFATSVQSTKTIKKVTSTAEYIHVLDYDYEGTHEWDITIETTGTDIEVPLTITYEDGTEESLTVYITKDWDYNWGE
jgi:hypothetical protein